ncbi:flagellar motor protein MotB [Niallia endozanthoxylica]|uniref:Flagellar motor protein MotB n=1 Tax=Niallia endozanthoxylica TaxID=2036016 RepID=A0A5J5I3Z4_9BACI|nr:flagellar motor protein MotB [Niallia endozanthoxylica]KAA9031194.1 flagellar motor protein MotB [Niallia endozanthoxylica]
MSRRKKKKKKGEEHIDESWLLPYSDLQTLLVALFIVLFASSTVSEQKLIVFSQAFSSELLTGGTGVFDYPGPIPTKDRGLTEVDDKNQSQEQVPEDVEETDEQRAEHERLEAIQDKVNSYIEENGLGEQLDTSLTVAGLSVRIRDNVLFDSGVAEVRAENISIANEISKLLEMDVPRSVIVSGHTDNVPIKNARFDSNWELSVMRAVNFMKLMLENPNLNPQLFSAKGYGEFQPIAANDTAEGRAQNRRVEILILPRSDETIQ